MNSYEERFAYNINRLRTKHGLTQKQFAKKLDCSEKTVSKWECIGSVPSIDTLYKIAAIFNVKLDDLFSEESIYLLGIDGGGTKTVFCLSDENFNTVKEIVLSGCNPIDIGIEKAKEILGAGICEVCEGISYSSIAMFAGLAGGASGGMKEELAKFFSQFGFKAYENGSDTQNILSAALGSDDGIIIIMGTGCCAIAQHDGVQDRIGGWGYLFDEGGSGYSIARDAFSACFKYIDGSGEYTLFADEVLKNYTDPQELLGALYKGSKKFIASFCPLVFECADKHDVICESIINRNNEAAEDIIRTAVNKINGKQVKIVVAGSLSKLPRVKQHMYRAFSDTERYSLSVLESPPVQGALIYAKKTIKQ